MPSGVQTCALDRKSTRLNSRHTIISYAVFCLKKNTPPLISLDTVIPRPLPRPHSPRPRLSAADCVSIVADGDGSSPPSVTTRLTFFLNAGPPRDPTLSPHRRRLSP